MLLKSVYKGELPTKPGILKVHEHSSTFFILDNIPTYL